MKKKILAGAGILLMLLSLAALLYADRAALKEEVFTFGSQYKGKPVTLEATLYEQPGAEHAVLICPGYSCDRQKWLPFAAQLRQAGVTVMVFDYAGQGASSGTIGFDNAKNDDIPAEIDDAIAALMERIGLKEDKIILLGHSMGGRAILRLLSDYNRPGAVTRVSRREIRNVILISPEVNYLHSEQASLFAGTSDDSEEPWAGYTEADIRGTNVYLFGSTADDVVSDGCILQIYAHLGARNVPAAGEYRDTQENASGSRLTTEITGGVLHSYQMYSPRFADYALNALSEITGKAIRLTGWELYLVYAGWGMALLGVALLLAGISGRRVPDEDRLPVLKDAKRFLLRKLLLWLPGMLMAFVICSVCVVIPFGSPIMNIPYMCFIAGYGLVMLLCYRKGRFAGTEGKLPRLTLRCAGGKKNTLLAAGVTVAILAFVWGVLRLSMYRLMPMNTRWFWLAFAGALMFAGFYVSGAESDMLKAAKAGRGVKIVYSLIQYIPLILFVLFYLVIGSYSGLIGQILNVALMYILFIPVGDFLRARTGNRMIGALVTAFAFQAFMITSAALIALLSN